jgi:hypothetical protein
LAESTLKVSQMLVLNHCHSLYGSKRSERA